MTEVLSRSPSTCNIGTTTKLSQNVAAGVTKPAVLGGGRRRHGKSKRRRSRRRGSGSRKPKSVKGPRAVTSEERTPGSRILHNKTRGVKFDRTGVVSVSSSIFTLIELRGRHSSWGSFLGFSSFTLTMSCLPTGGVATHIYSQPMSC